MRKHWVRLLTACNSSCVFCLDADTPRGIYFDEQTVEADIDEGRRQGAERIILSGGEPTLHPAFHEFVRYAQRAGYERVQVVSNGSKFADRAFFEASVQAGLGEITFSLHGHTADLHDRLTRTPGSFKRLLKGLVRALREPRLIVNVDIVINKQNVATVDKIVELCIDLGVSEFDLLHIIPQAAAFENRSELFYDVREHLPRLQRVFALNRHPRVVVWTNRFPVSYLEGMEELIQDPSKILDEINGRRFPIRRYLDTAEPLDCRTPERCRHCFIEPFCTTMDRVIAAQREDQWQVWWVGSPPTSAPRLPFGCQLLGVRAANFAELARIAPSAAQTPLYALVSSAESLDDAPRQPPIKVLVARDAAQLDAWLGQELPPGLEIDIELNLRTAPWLLQHRETLSASLDQLWLRQPSHRELVDARKQDVRQPRRFFEQLDLPIRCSGLPICMAVGTTPTTSRMILDAALFDDQSGRLDIRALGQYHIAQHYRAKSVRCADCAVTEHCEGVHINMARDQGLAQLEPLTTTSGRAERELVALSQVGKRGLRLADGRRSEPVAASLPGFPEAPEPPPDPLALFAEAQPDRHRPQQVEPEQRSEESDDAGQ